MLQIVKQNKPECREMKTIAIISLIGIVLVSGCAGTKQFHVKLESDPPGARVFLSLGATARQAAKNRSYLGATPCTATVLGTSAGYFVIPKIGYASDYVAGSATFIAEPPFGTEGQYPQSITYRGQTEYVGGDKIPQAVFFDMRKSP